MRTPKKSALRTASAPAGGLPADRRADDAIWPRVTHEVADDLAVDAVSRDRAGLAPYDEVARLQEAGLPALLTAPGPLGRGADWRTACAVVREISAADGSVGELLAHHCVLSWTSRFLGAPAGPRSLDSRTAKERWLLAGAVEPPRPEPGRPGLALTPAGGGGYLLDGRGAFASAVTVADRLVVGARCTETGDLLLVLADPAHPAVTAEPCAERVGQRLAGAGTVAFERLPVGPGNVLGTLPRDEHTVAPYATLAPLALRLLLVHVALGIAEGALAEARDVSRAGLAAAPHAADPAAGDDPYLLRAYGELATSAHTAAAVVERATDALARGLLAERLLDVEERSDIAVLVAAAETVAHPAALDITTRILQLVAPAGPPPGFDRFWRNARALTAPVPPDHRLRDIGDHYLNGTHARLTLLA
ncbi:acyl-CoA dehydrogenase [Streptomyces sp. SKN60]|uniref:acyl-CoA dehydrogenase n=1 Tax=Streptomyces sp. SKN60 TaxID=2855506 RepID=UPI0022459161|nr:acyl-CoA dehydrogenase [Streptomyces sp. SKN60]MCX2181369.1 acyl-CoA dehydrogenase [Streptomyces sp. SKN60]